LGMDNLYGVSVSLPICDYMTVLNTSHGICI